MCFSTTASFSAGAILSLIGLLSIKNVNKKNVYPFAAIPLFFGIQQACEGFVWIGLQTSNQLYMMWGIYSFLFFALIWWPLYIPYAIQKFKTPTLHKKLLGYTQATGIAFAGLITYLLLAAPPTAQIVENHIAYTMHYPATAFLIGMVFYIFCTMLPFFISSDLLKLLGLMLVISLIISWFFYRVAFTSVWCFFAALLSVMILGIVSRLKYAQ